VEFKPELPALRLATRDAQIAQQWCNEMADIADAGVDLLVVGLGAPTRVHCVPSRGPLDGIEQLERQIREFEEAMAEMRTGVAQWLPEL
jgi:hypothetical protein